MKIIIIAVLILIGLMDYALAVMCSHTEDREAYLVQKRRKDKE